MHLLLSQARKLIIGVVGITILLIGIAMLVLPGPGWVVIFVGLALLATEFVWAQRLLARAKETAVNARDKVLRRNGAGEASPSRGPDAPQKIGSKPDSGTRSGITQ